MSTHPVIHIDSSDDSRLDVFARLTDNQLRNRLDPSRGVMICESHFVIETALAAGCKPLSFLANTSHTDTILQMPLVQQLQHPRQGVLCSTSF